MTRALIYCRISLDSTGEGAGVARQEEACRKLCDLRGWEVAHVLTDNSISAYSGKVRPSWEQALALVAAGEVDVIVAWHIDRMTRSLLDLEQLILLAQERGVGIATATGDIDLTTDVGRMVARILAAVARAEVERKAARQRLAHEQRAAEGRPWWAARPFGYERDGSTVPKEAAALRQAYADVLGGTSLYSICQRWNDSGLLTPKGKPWRAANLRHVLMHQRNAGIHTHRGHETGATATWEAMVAPEVHRAVVRLLQDPTRLTNGGGRRKGLLTGFVSCSKCGGKVLQGWSKPNKDGDRYRIYVCRRGRCITIPADWLEGYLIREVARRADDWRHLAEQDDPVDDAELSDLRTEEQTLLARQEDLAVMFAEGVLTADALRSGTAAVRERLEEVCEELMVLTSTSSGIDASDIEQVWEYLDDPDEQDRLRSLLERLTTAVELLPRGKGVRDPRPEHVRIEWAA